MSDYAQGAWQAERGNAIKAMSSLNQANVNIDYLNGIVREQSARIARMERELMVKEAHAEGLSAQLRGFISSHPDSPERSDSGKRYKDGKVKSRGRIRYETAFDSALAGKIADPAKLRVD